MTGSRTRVTEIPSITPIKILSDPTWPVREHDKYFFYVDADCVFWFIFLYRSQWKYEEPDTKRSRVCPNMNTNCKNLIVTGIPYHLSEIDLMEYFLQFGNLLLVRVYNDNFTLSYLRKLQNSTTLVDRTRCVWELQRIWLH